MKNFLTFKQAKKILKRERLKCVKDYQVFLKNYIPSNLPVNPHQKYKDEWNGWGDFLNYSFASFEEARKFAHKLKFKTQREWKDYCAASKNPDCIPICPNGFYKEHWTHWGDFLGSGKRMRCKAPRDGKYLPYEEAKIYVNNLKLKSCKDWERYCGSGNKLSKIPSNPRFIYKNEFESWKKWLGKVEK
jgi:hypothetical protein